MPSVIRFADRPAAPWANGLGSTVEIARDPESGPFDWRISVARIEADAPFSLLPGVGRALMALEDESLRLVVDGSPRILQQYDVLVFRGESDVRPVGIEKPGSDLNLMTRSGRVEGTLEAVRLGGDSTIGETADERTIAVLLAGRVRLRDSAATGGETTLATLDAAVAEQGEGLHLVGTGLLAVARLARVGR